MTRAAAIDLIYFMTGRTRKEATEMVDTVGKNADAFHAYFPLDNCKDFREVIVARTGTTGRGSAYDLQVTFR